MRESIINKLSFANVVSVIALFVALSGAAYAGGLVTGKSIENGSITGKDLAANTITGKQIKEDKLKGVDDCSSATPLENGDVCFGPVQPAANWQAALKSCVFQNLRLPSFDEAMLIVAQAQTRSTYIWSSDFVDATATPTTRAVARTSPAPTFGVRPETDALPYRCASSARN